MTKLAFYEVNTGYADYLRRFEPKIPNIKYSENDKFVCGVVLKIKELCYFAPISSFKKQQKTNILIKNKTGKILSSIRFSFMFPIPETELSIKDFSLENEKYKFLLMEELKFCNKNIDKIREKALYTYKRRLSGMDKIINENCCDFKLLEEKCKEYVKEKSMEDNLEL